MQRTRHAGLLGALPAALRFRALAHTMTGELGDAAALVAEAQAIDRAAGVPSLVYADAALVAWRAQTQPVAAGGWPTRCHVPR
jgi:hypothetical protein